MIGLVLALPLLSINMQQTPQEDHWLSKPFSLLSSSISEVFYGFSHGVKSTTGMYVNLINIKKDNESLKSTNNELNARLEKMTELSLENDRLRELLSFKESTKMQLTAAQVIGRDLVIDHNTITINKGLRDGIKAGQGVITTKGALGYIFRPDAFTSHVMLITDRYSVVDGIVQRTRAHGIVEGRSQATSTLTLKYVEKTEDVKEGDVVVTGDLDNIFPKGFPIAMVESVERKTFSVSLKVDLRPLVDPYKVEEVFVVNDSAKEDMTERFAPTASVDAVPGTDITSPTTGAAGIVPAAATATMAPAAPAAVPTAPHAAPVKPAVKPQEKPQ